LNISETEIPELESPTRMVETRMPSGEAIPQVSVVVIAKDEERTIGKCISSILRQDYTNFEIIFVDSNSTDRTSEIVESLVPTNRHVFLTTSRENAAAARNAGLRLAHGQSNISRTQMILMLQLWVDHSSKCQVSKLRLHLRFLMLNPQC
jgi:cellulose synthase/poly-beta-1,6-N-acetylglucosamine synthase-like glycosyltransferase